MSLKITISNISELAPISDYEYQVKVGTRTLAHGIIKGHARKDGWKDLTQRVLNESVTVAAFVNPKGERVESNESRLLFREDGRVEKVCKHGCGHPVGHVKEWQEWMGVHGCCGCCMLAEFHL